MAVQIGRAGSFETPAAFLLGVRQYLFASQRGVNRPDKKSI
jgi:hypothetical protein